MDINKLLQGYDCSCGKHHTCEISHVYIETDAIRHLSTLCADYERILIVADENTFATCGDKVKSVLSKKTVSQIIFSGAKVLVPDEIAVEAVNEKLTDVDLIIGIGSGVIQDLCKYTAFTNTLPYFVVATAPSMDGYASTGAAMIMGGMKVTYSAKVPDAIIAEPEILANAPMEMIKAGYGDIIGKYSALNDWKLSRLVNDEYYCQEIYDLVYDMINKTLNLSDGLLKQNPESVKALMEALVIVGIAMSFAGSSRPASGSEHHLSHFFEITGLANDEYYFPHGIDVAYSTVVTQELREKLLSLPNFDKTQFELPREAYVKKIKEIYGDAAEGCIALQDKMNRYNENRTSIYSAKETEIRALLSEVPSSARIVEMLNKVALEMPEFYNTYSAKKIAHSISWAKDLKDRYTVLWMYYDLFGTN